MSLQGVSPRSSQVPGWWCSSDGRGEMKAEILTIGDELLRGEIIDSNKSFLSDRLLSLDIETRFHT